MQKIRKNKARVAILALFVALVVFGVSACLIGKGKACDANNACATNLACIQGWCLPPDEFGDLRSEAPGQNANPDAAAKD